MTIMPIETKTICAGDVDTWRGQTVDETKLVYTDTVFHASGCAKEVYELHLTVDSMTIMPIETMTICAGDVKEWRDQIVDETKLVYTDTVFHASGCIKEVYELHLTVDSMTIMPIETKTICAGDVDTWRDQIVDETKLVYTDTVFHASGCIKEVYELHLTVDSMTIMPIETMSICSGDVDTWHDQTVDETKLVYTDTVFHASGCAKEVYEMHLTVYAAIETPFVELDTICSGDSYIWHGQVVDENTLFYYDTAHYVATGCDSAYYELHLSVYNVTMPTVMREDIIAICGNAIDVHVADSIILAHIDADPLYAEVNAIIWEKKINGDWVELNSAPIVGDEATVTVRYTIQTACEDITSEAITAEVQTPTPENDEEMTNIPAYNKYGGRLLTADITYIREMFGWNVAVTDVTWYRVVEGATDEVVGTGYYLTTEDGTPLPNGTYYARINHTRVTPEECDGILQTINLIVSATAEGPKLVPTVARPHELIQLLNLDPDAVSTIRIYSTTGELIDTFQVTDKKDTTFRAAHMAGYYIVDVQTATEKVSLRYIVK